MTVIPMKRTPRRIAIVVIVFAAFFASGGLNAGTPFAIASTPVRATEPPAKDRRNRTIRRIPVDRAARTGPRPAAAGRPARSP